MGGFSTSFLLSGCDYVGGVILEFDAAAYCLASALLDYHTCECHFEV